MDDTTYRHYCLDLLGSFVAQINARAEHCAPDDPLRELAAGFTAVSGGEGLYEQGPGLVARLFASVPDLAPLFPREMLWFMGGDCLHYMPDEEQAAFQALEDLRAEAAAQGEVLDYHREKTRLLKLQ